MNARKRIGWKVLVGPTSSYISGIADPSRAIDIKIQECLKDGWVLKGEMIRAHPSATIWSQIVEKYETK